jgi:hypothetical protein
MVERRASYANYQIGKGEVKRNLNPLDSSFLHAPVIAAEPYTGWVQLAHNTRELNYLQELFRMIPINWLCWVDKRIEREKIKRGDYIADPLNYKLSILTRGIISLQETKYICDVLENALRQVVISHIASNEITYGQMSDYVPNFDDVFCSFVKDRGEIAKSDVVAFGFVMSLSFYQLVEVIARKWKVFHYSPFIRGFGLYFIKDKACRDYCTFRREMTAVRRCRNIIAHTKELLSAEQTAAIFNTGRKWLAPLGIDLYDRISAYRMHRPDFLKDIEQPVKFAGNVKNRQFERVCQ